MGPAPLRGYDHPVSTLLLNSGEWDREKIQRLFPALKHVILGIKPSKKGAKDKMIWLKSKSGIYTTKSGYHAAMEDVDEGINIPGMEGFDWIREVWMLNIPNKLKLFIWKIFHEAIPTGDNLIKRGIQIEGKCTKCAEPETLIHLLVHCNFALQVWRLAPFSKDFSDQDLAATRMVDFWKIAKKRVCLPPTGLAAGPLTPWILWHLWIARNQKIFQDKNFTAEETINRALTAAKEWTSAQQPVQNRRREVHDSCQQGTYMTCKIDAAWMADKKAAGLAWIFNRPTEAPIAGSKALFFVGSPLMGEALAMRTAMEQAILLGYKDITFESDSMQLVKALTEHTQVAELHGIICDIVSSSVMFDSVNFQAIPRSVNGEADLLAKQALANFVTNL